MRSITTFNLFRVKTDFLSISLHGITVFANLIYFKILLDTIGYLAYTDYQTIIGFTWFIQLVSISGFAPIYIRFGLNKKENVANQSYYFRLLITLTFAAVCSIFFMVFGGNYLAFLTIIFSNVASTFWTRKFFVYRKFVSLRLISLTFVVSRTAFMLIIYSGLESWVIFEAILAILIIILELRNFRIIELRSKVLKRAILLTFDSFWANLATYVDRMILGLLNPSLLVNYHLACAPVNQAKGALKPIIDEMVISDSKPIKFLVRISPIIILFISILFVHYYYRVDDVFVYLYTVPLSLSYIFINLRLELAMQYARSDQYIRNMKFARNASISKVVLTLLVLIFTVRLYGYVILLFELTYLMIYRQMMSNKG